MINQSYLNTVKDVFEQIIDFKKNQLFCKKGLQAHNLIGNIYLVVATEQRRQWIEDFFFLSRLKFF